MEKTALIPQLIAKKYEDIREFLSGEVNKIPTNPGELTDAQKREFIALTRYRTKANSYIKDKIR